jgi:hypothetical protein
VEALRVAAVQHAVHLLEDVAPLSHRAQARLPIVGQAPGAGCNLLGQAKVLEVLKPPEQGRALWFPATRLGQ